MDEDDDTNDLFEKKVKTFDDIVTLNVLFLRGKLDHTPYHADPIYDMPIDDLVKLHYLGFISTNGQSSECIKNKKITKGPNKGKFWSMQQKSYLSGLLRRSDFTSKFLEYFLTEAENHNIKYLITSYPEGITDGNFTTSINLTKEKLISAKKWNLFTNMNPEYVVGEEISNFRGKAAEIFQKGCFELQIFIDEYCKGDVTKELLGMMLEFMTESQRKTVLKKFKKVIRL